MEIIINKKKDLINLGSKIKIYQNSNLVDVLNYDDKTKQIRINETTEITEIYFKILWCESNKVLLTKNKLNVNIDLEPRIGERLTLIIVFSVILIMFLSLVVNKSLANFIFIPLLYPFYYITFGRKYFLKATIR